ncbi:glycoside hydrolase family 47 protein [Annulohypoxylon truncatum]|uniref:glycoside hydrolase family 47 protein n=1 Tax=Annulohypoxylon truncatum TaxID=327061 RepID=UPI0020082D6E|nr:glycoside hydrolase family 47 protein [Annulohypoxylon truncatum]KAI1213947.1 glycoside hydrolase family 47 protein [Annulohypoxylon truncatum]
MILRRRFWLPFGIAVALLLLFYSGTTRDIYSWAGAGRSARRPHFDKNVIDDEGYFWRRLPTHYPVKDMKPLPTGRPRKLPKIQTNFGKESPKDAATRKQRQEAVKKAFIRCWDSYKAKAFMSDELAPISGKSKDTFGGWGATLVDSLDTLWIMSLREEFEEAVAAVVDINFTISSLETVNAFETTIRYLGGFLSAYDLSGDQRLLRKAREVGDMLYKVFDTPNRMPITRWDFDYASQGGQQVANEAALLAEVGSFCMEFTRLSLITGDPKWFDATERVREVFEEQQSSTQLPGMWPFTLNPREKQFAFDNTFGLGALADSTYEYLPKMYALMGGLLPSYQNMYEDSMKTTTKHNFFRPMVPDTADILISGTLHTVKENDKMTLDFEHEGQHLVCFAGGMLAVGGKLFEKAEHLEAARKLVDGCIWAYKAMPLGIMPETFFMAPCKSATECEWDESLWKRAILHQAGEKDLTNMEKADEIISKSRLPKGFTQITQAKYILRPEAIESVFILYRITGRPDLLESAWAMFEAIEKNTKTPLANAALSDVTVASNPPKTDSMESFWMGETLKYFYLIFSEPDLISLDEWVFNTEAHPFKRLVR